jgi:hypothetical protein
MEAEEIQENLDDQPMQDENSGLTIIMLMSFCPLLLKPSSTWSKIQI